MASYYDWVATNVITAARLNAPWDASGNLTLGGSKTVGTTTTPIVSINIDNAATDGGAIYFNSGTTSFLKSSADGLTLSTGGFTALSSTATLSIGAITGPTTVNTINGLIINTGALSGITTLGLTGAMSGGTTIDCSGNITQANGTSLTNTISSVNGNSEKFVRIQGTQASPTALPAADYTIGSLDFFGQYDTTVGHIYEGAQIAAASAEAFSNGHAGSYIIFSTCGIASSSCTEKLRIGSDGKLTSLQTYAQAAGGTNRAMLVDNTGVLGNATSSLRYKKNVIDMPDTSWIYNLRPVMFDYIDESKGVKCSGLIAEEVEKINPSLCTYQTNVIRDSEGKVLSVENTNIVETVEYHRLIPMLLKEIQKLNDRIKVLETK